LDPLTALGKVLKFVSPIDVFVDLLADSADDHEARWRQLFFHLAPRGVWIVDNSAAAAVDIRLATNRWIATMTAEESESHGSVADRALADATLAFAMTRDVLIVRKRGTHLWKLRDSDANKVLAEREPSLTVIELAKRPGGDLRSNAEVISHESGVPIRGLPEEMRYPDLHLRHYQGMIVYRGGMLVHTDRTILPDSFPWPLERNLTNPGIRKVTPNFAKVPDELPRRTLKGNYYLLDPQYSGGHFGHVMTEVVGRLWGWDEAKRRIPDLKAIFRIKYSNQRDPKFEKRLLRAYGISEEDIVWVDEPVYLTSLVSATEMWQNREPYYAHPDLPDVWNRLAKQMVDPDAPKYDRIFVSRTDKWSRRTCRNAQRVESLFKEYGFSIVYPETLDVSTQAGIFANAKVIAGFGGSAMFNLMYARCVQTLIVLNHESYLARNEHLYSSLLGCTAHYFWSAADIAQPPDRRSIQAEEAGWEFDFGRNRPALVALLTAL